MHRFFLLRILCAIVPAHIRDVLVSRYEYIVAEREVVPDLTDDLRLCETCKKWCPPCVQPVPTVRASRRVLMPSPLSPLPSLFLLPHP